jgi:hypothetical protein
LRAAGLVLAARAFRRDGTGQWTEIACFRSAAAMN